MRQMLVRAGEKSYLTAKFLATFIAGGLAMVVPLIINFMLTALFIPAITPVPTYDTMYGVFGNSLFSSLYYTQPFAYVAVYMLVDFMFCGAWHVLRCCRHYLLNINGLIVFFRLLSAWY